MYHINEKRGKIRVFRDIFLATFILFFIFTGITLFSVHIYAQNPDQDEQNSSSGSIFPPVDRIILQDLNNAKKLVDLERYADAIQIITLLLESSEDYYFPVQDNTSIYRSIRSEAQQLLLKMPPRGRQLYELQAGTQARRALQAAISSGKPELLGEVTHKYFHTEAGYEAAFLIGLNHLDHNHAIPAALSFQRLYDIPEARKKFDPLLTLLLAVSWNAAGMPDQANILYDSLKRMENDSELNQLMIGGKSLAQRPATEDLSSWLQKQLPLIQNLTPSEINHWILMRGNLQRNATMDADSSLLTIRWRVPVLDTPEAQAIIELIRQSILVSEQPDIPQLFPIYVGDTVLMRTAWNLVAVDIKTGKRLWDVPMDGYLDILKKIEKRQNQNENQNQDLNTQRLTVVSQILRSRIWNEGIYGTLSSNGTLVYCIEDTLISDFGINRPVFAGMNPGSEDSDGSHLSFPNRLAAYDIKTGKLIWHIGGKKGKWLLPETDTMFLGAPTPIGDELYVIAQRKGEVLLLTLNAMTGKTIRSQLLCIASEIPTLPYRPALSPSYAEGILICPTPNSALVAVDLSTHSILWAHAYYNSLSHKSRLNRFHFQHAAQEFTRVDTSVIIVDGKILYIPSDSSSIICLKLLDGQQLWKHDAPRALYLAGVYQGKVYVVDHTSIFALDLLPKTFSQGQNAGTSEPKQPKEIFQPIIKQLVLGKVSGMGFRSDAHYFLPLAEGKIVKIDLPTLSVVETAVSREQNIPGNIIPAGDRILSQRAVSLDSYHQKRAIPAELQYLYTQDAAHPDALILEANYLLSEGNLAKAVQILRKAAAINDPQAKTLLKHTLLEGLRKDFNHFATLREEIIPLLSSPEEHFEFQQFVISGLINAGRLAEALTECQKLLKSIHYFNSSPTQDSTFLFAENEEWHENPDLWFHHQLQKISEIATEKNNQEILTAVNALADAELKKILQEDSTPKTSVPQHDSQENVPEKNAPAFPASTKSSSAFTPVSEHFVSTSMTFSISPSLISDMIPHHFSAVTTSETTSETKKTENTESVKKAAGELNSEKNSTPVEPSARSEKEGKSSTISTGKNAEAIIPIKVVSEIKPIPVAPSAPKGIPEVKEEPRFPQPANNNVQANVIVVRNGVVIQSSNNPSPSPLSQIAATPFTTGKAQEKLQQYHTFLRQFMNHPQTGTARQHFIQLLKENNLFSQAELVICQENTTGNPEKTAANLAAIIIMYESAGEHKTAAPYYVYLQKTYPNINCFSGKTPSQWLASLPQNHPLHKHLQKPPTWATGRINVRTQQENSGTKTRPYKFYNIISPSVKGKTSIPFHEMEFSLMATNSGSELTIRNPYGQSQWTINMNSLLNSRNFADISSIITRGHYIITHSRQGGLVAFDVRTEPPTLLWSWSPPQKKLIQEDTIISPIIERLKKLDLPMNLESQHSLIYRKGNDSLQRILQINDHGVCLLSDNNIICLDILTGEVLWQRNILNEDTQSKLFPFITGDENYLYLLEYFASNHATNTLNSNPAKYNLNLNSKYIELNSSLQKPGDTPITAISTFYGLTPEEIKELPPRITLKDVSLTELYSQDPKSPAKSPSDIPYQARLRRLALDLLRLYTKIHTKPQTIYIYDAKTGRSLQSQNYPDGNIHKYFTEFTHEKLLFTSSQFFGRYDIRSEKFDWINILMLQPEPLAKKPEPESHFKTKVIGDHIIAYNMDSTIQLFNTVTGELIFTTSPLLPSTREKNAAYTQNSLEKSSENVSASGLPYRENISDVYFASDGEDGYLVFINTIKKKPLPKKAADPQEKQEKKQESEQKKEEGAESDFLEEEDEEELPLIPERQFVSISPISGSTVELIKNAVIFRLNAKGMQVWEKPIQIPRSFWINSIPMKLPILAFGHIKHKQQVSHVLQFYDKQTGRILYHTENPGYISGSLNVYGDPAKNSVSAYLPNNSFLEFICTNESWEKFQPILSLPNYAGKISQMEKKITAMETHLESLKSEIAKAKKNLEDAKQNSQPAEKNDEPSLDPELPKTGEDQKIAKSQKLNALKAPDIKLMEEQQKQIESFLEKSKKELETLRSGKNTEAEEIYRDEFDE
ncbi:MAG: PQQ-binding-like beta-propeller repeat protein [Planctomycetia bacterium]|nr:PQQ-binding-like beta-propeller repeat protein [Planctomycetia bacterium]